MMLVTSHLLLVLVVIYIYTLPTIFFLREIPFLNSTSTFHFDRKHVFVFAVVLIPALLYHPILYFLAS